MVKIIAKHKDHRWIIKFINEDNDAQTLTFIYIKKDRDIFLKKLYLYGDIINGKSIKKGTAIRRYFWARYI